MTQESTPHRHRWFQFSLATIFAVVAIAALVAWIVRPRPFPDPEKTIESVEVVIDDGATPISLQIVDPNVIRTSIARPFMDSTRDKNPARYAVLGTIQINYTNGDSGRAILFLPWGHWKRGDTYWMADLTLLKEECKALLQQSSDPKSKQLLREPALWDPSLW